MSPLQEQPVVEAAASCALPAGSHCGMRAYNDRARWFTGGKEACSHEPLRPLRTNRIVLLGAPGVGKGTQAELLARHLAACHLATGDLFRNLMTLQAWERTPAMNAALEYMQRGELVPDGTVLDLIRDRFHCIHCPTGFLLDGFPRTVPQAEALDRLLDPSRLSLNAVLNFELSLDHNVARLAGRRICLHCKAVYHVEARPPRVQGVCDRCGQALYQREDDRPDAIRVRMEAFARSTAPLVDFYTRRGLLVTVSAEGTPDEVCDRALQSLNGRV